MAGFTRAEQIESAGNNGFKFGIAFFLIMVSQSLAGKIVRLGDIKLFSIKVVLLSMLTVIVFLILALERPLHN